MLILIFSKIDKKHIKPSKIECSKLVPYSEGIYESKKIGLGGVPLKKILITFFFIYVKELKKLLIYRKMLRIITLRYVGNSC